MRKSYVVFTLTLALALLSGGLGRVVFARSEVGRVAQAPAAMSTISLPAVETPIPSEEELLQSPNQNPNFKDDDVVVKFQDYVTPTMIDQIVVSRGARVYRYIASLNVYVLRTKRYEAVTVVNTLRQDPAVAWAELNYEANAVLTPSDPDYGDPTKVYAPQIINAATAWDYTTGAGDVIVAVVDSGVSLNHPEFAGRLLPGYDFVNNDNDPSDDQGHGTHVAGIVAAAMNNDQGTTGIAPNVLILPVKVLDVNNLGYWANIAAGITYAVDNDAQVINLSLGGATTSQVLREAVLYAAANGVFVAAAAGNNGVSTPFYPAYYDETMAVAASDAQDARWALSNYGSWVDIAAPGSTIWSTYWISANPNGYQFMSGTSMAAPHVAGLAALLLSSRPQLASTDMRAIIQQTAADRGDPGRDIYYGWGRINAGAALIASQNWGLPTATPTTSAIATPTPTPIVTPTPTPSTPTATPLSPTATPTATPTAFPPLAYRVNAGDTSTTSPAYTDGQGKVWAKDKLFATGSWGYTTGSAKPYTSAVAGTIDDPLYQKLSRETRRVQIHRAQR